MPGWVTFFCRNAQHGYQRKKAYSQFCWASETGKKDNRFEDICKIGYSGGGTEFRSGDDEEGGQESLIDRKGRAHALELSMTLKNCQCGVSG